MSNVINLTRITILQWIIIVIFSGVVVAAINQLGAWLIGSHQTRSQERIQERDLKFRERQQKDEREDQSLQLLITAHFNQRKESLKEAVDVRQWIWEQLYRTYGPDHDYYGDDEPAGELSTVIDVLSALNRVAYFHPTKSTREVAKDLRGDIGAHFNSINGNEVGGTPSETQLDRWLKSADKLIELIHTPPNLGEVRHTKSSADVDRQPPPEKTKESRKKHWRLRRRKKVAESSSEV